MVDAEVKLFFELLLQKHTRKFPLNNTPGHDNYWMKSEMRKRTKVLLQPSYRNKGPSPCSHQLTSSKKKISQSQTKDIPVSLSALFTQEILLPLLALEDNPEALIIQRTSKQWSKRWATFQNKRHFQTMIFASQSGWPIILCKMALFKKKKKNPNFQNNKQKS